MKKRTAPITLPEDVPDSLRILKGPETAKLLRIHEQSLRRMRAEGRGPKFIKPDGLIRYRLSDVLAYLENGESK